MDYLGSSNSIPHYNDFFTGKSNNEKFRIYQNELVEIFNKIHKIFFRGESKFGSASAQMVADLFERLNNLNDAFYYSETSFTPEQTASIDKIHSRLRTVKEKMESWNVIQDRDVRKEMKIASGISLPLVIDVKEKNLKTGEEQVIKRLVGKRDPFIFTVTQDQIDRINKHKEEGTELPPDLKQVEENIDRAVRESRAVNIVQDHLPEDNSKKNMVLPVAIAGIIALFALR